MPFNFPEGDLATQDTYSVPQGNPMFDFLVTHGRSLRVQQATQYMEAASRIKTYNPATFEESDPILTAVIQKDCSPCDFTLKAMFLQNLQGHLRMVPYPRFAAGSVDVKPWGNELQQHFDKFIITVQIPYSRKDELISWAKQAQEMDYYQIIKQVPLASLKQEEPVIAKPVPMDFD